MATKKQIYHREYMQKWRKNNREKTKRYKKNWEKQNREKALAYKRQYMKRWRTENQEKDKESRKKYRANNKEARLKANKEYDKKNPKRKKARKRLQHLVRIGKIKKSNGCSICGSNYFIDGHHDDYNKPEIVFWLCRNCHVKLHLEVGK